MYRLLQGINDNGSSAFALLELALNLGNFTYKNAVRFAWWAVEEAGLVGSKYYVDRLTPEESSKIALYFNFDMIASPNTGYFILDIDCTDGPFPKIGECPPAGTIHIRETFQSYYTNTAKLKTSPVVVTNRSDFQPFVNAGFPVGMLHTGAN